jgi:dCMP deaminase
MRISNDEYFMGIAQAVAKRSTCRRRQIGAVIVSGGPSPFILATGYNGAPRGMEHCLDKGCLRDEKNIPSGEQQQICRAVHAEQNSIIQAASHGANLDGAIMYCSVYPCIICAKMIINTGIRKVVYSELYTDRLAEGMFKKVRMGITKVEQK